MNALWLGLTGKLDISKVACGHEILWFSVLKKLDRRVSVAYTQVLTLMPMSNLLAHGNVKQVYGQGSR